MNRSRCWLTVGVAVCLLGATGLEGVEGAEPVAPEPSAEIQALLDAGYESLEGDPTAAMSEFERALGKAAVSGDRAGEARSHAACAKALESLDRSEKALSGWTAAAAAWAKLKFTPGEVGALVRSSLLLEAEGNPRSEARFEEALKLMEAETSRPAATADTVQDIAFKAFHRGRLEFAHRVMTASIDMRRIHQPGTRALADGLFWLAVMERGAGESDEERDTLLEALAVEEGMESRSEDVAKVLLSLGESEVMLGLFDEAEEHLLRSMQIRRDLGADERLVGEALAGLGMMSVYRGDMEAAKEYFAESVRIEEEYGEDPVELARMLINQGWVPIELQHYGEARRIYQRALDLLDEHGPEHPARAKALSNLAEITIRQGDTRAAAEYSRQANEMWEKTAPESMDQSMTLTRLGNIAATEGRFDAAYEYQSRALAIRERLLPESGWVGESLHFLARVELNLGRPDEAEAHELRALELYGGLEDCCDMTQAQMVNTLGLISRGRGDLDESEKYLALAVKSWQEYGGDNHPATAECMVNLAGTISAKREYRRAMATAAEADRMETHHSRLTARFLPESEGVEFAHDFLARDVAMSLATGPLAKDAGSVRLAWNAVIRGRALVFDEMAARHEAVRYADNPRVFARFEELRLARDGVARLAVRGPSEDGAADYLAELEAATVERERAEMALAEVSAEYRSNQARENAGIEDIESAVAPGQALVAYVRFERSGFDDFPHDWAFNGDLMTETYAAFVLAHARATPMMIVLGDAVEVEDAVTSLRQQIGHVLSAGSRATTRGEASFRESAVGLRQLVWDPIESHLRGAEAVIVVPDGALNLVDFALLPADDDRYLIETGPRFHYLTAERDLVEPVDSMPGGMMLAFGNPNFNEPKVFASLSGSDGLGADEPVMKVASLQAFRGQRASCGSFQDMRFDPLPASETEVAEVVTVWSETGGAGRVRGASSHGPGVRTMTGGDATEHAFKEMAPQSGLLHLATHGFFLGGECAKVLGEEGEEEFRLQSENPLVLSGLALAGANLRSAAGPDEEDGILTAEEIASLDLTGVDWAVLSACDTGLGEIEAGEGVIGLRRAFQIAGAQTLIMSLWPVDDEVTRSWMRELYTNRFVHDMSTIDSVHEASFALLNERRERGLSTHPFYWAGFIASGDWR